jgi:hypothetical protein
MTVLRVIKKGKYGVWRSIMKGDMHKIYDNNSYKKRLLGRAHREGEIMTKCVLKNRVWTGLIWFRT